MISLQWLNLDTPGVFPPVEQAMKDPDGLLAAGGELTAEWLLSAYQQGIFPWFGENEPILWWSPDPRFVLFPDQLKVSRSLSKNIRNMEYRVTMDLAFEEVIHQCALQPRKNQLGTWISQQMIDAYIELHTLGQAHSVEFWQDSTLLGGIYGVHSGRVFCGESMFSKVSNASKIALFYLCRFLEMNKFELIDSQVYTEHLSSMGAGMIPRKAYIQLLKQAGPIDMPVSWTRAFEDALPSIKP